MHRTLHQIVRWEICGLQAGQWSTHCLCLQSHTFVMYEEWGLHCSLISSICHWIFVIVYYCYYMCASIQYKYTVGTIDTDATPNHKLQALVFLIDSSHDPHKPLECLCSKTKTTQHISTVFCVHHRWAQVQWNYFFLFQLSFLYYSIQCNIGGQFSVYSIDFSNTVFLM